MAGTKTGTRTRSLKTTEKDRILERQHGCKRRSFSSRMLPCDVSKLKVFGSKVHVRVGGSATRLEAQLVAMLRETVLRGSCHSCVLIGPRGSGKRHALARALRAATEAAGSERDVCVVRVSGLVLVGGEQGSSAGEAAAERAALAEAARQLSAHHGVPLPPRGASLADNLVFVRQMLRECGRVHCSVVFVVEEMDAFANRRQTFLYSVLDALQSAEVRAAVVGVSSRYDVLETLEKRVRSRFSNRRLIFEALSQDEAIEMFRAMLTAEEEDAAAREWNDEVASLLTGESEQAQRACLALRASFAIRCSQRHVRRLAIATMEMREWERIRSTRRHIASAGDDNGEEQRPVSTDGDANGTDSTEDGADDSFIPLTADHIVRAIAMMDENDIVGAVVSAGRSAPEASVDAAVATTAAMKTASAVAEADCHNGNANDGDPHLVHARVEEVAALSVLQLSVIVAMSRLAGREVDEPTFEEIYADYRDVQPTGGTGGVDLHGRGIVFSGLEHAMEMGLVAVAGVVGARAGRGISPSSLMQHASFSLLITKDEIHQGLERSPVCPQTLMRAFKLDV